MGVMFSVLRHATCDARLVGISSFGLLMGEYSEEAFYEQCYNVGATCDMRLARVSSFGLLMCGLLEGAFYGETTIREHNHPLAILCL